jgi:hypothetical protein
LTTCWNITDKKPRDLKILRLLLAPHGSRAVDPSVSTKGRLIDENLNRIGPCTISNGLMNYETRTAGA